MENKKPQNMDINMKRRKKIPSDYKEMRDKMKENVDKKIKVKRKINECPGSFDQKISKKYQVLQSFKPREKKKEKKKGPKLLNTASFISKSIGSYPRHGRPFKPVPTVEQYPGEAESHFLRRVKEVTKMVVEESQFQDKFNVNVKRNDIGEVVAVDKVPTAASREKNRKKRIRKLEKKLRKLRRGKGSEEAIEGDVTLRDEDEEEDIDERERKLFRKEVVQFGERVHAPPTLETAKLEKKVESDKKINMGAFLFYQTLEADGKKKEEKKKENKKNSSKTEEDKAREKMLEVEREKAIFAYRQQKAKREKEFSSNAATISGKKRGRTRPL